MNANFFVQAIILVGLVVIFLMGLSHQRKAFTQVLDFQRNDFMRFLHAQKMSSGPDTGAVPAAKPSTGPTKPPTSGRNVRRPTNLQ